MRVLVTGVAGFAGNYLAELLLKKGLEVYGISGEEHFKPFLAFHSSAIHYASLDIRNRARLSEFVNDVRPELVFHLAGKSSPSLSITSPQETFDVNFGGTLALLEALRVQKGRCRLLLVSSSHVYGAGPFAGPVGEDAPLRPETPYAASKAAAEMAAYQYWKTYGVETVTVRAFNHTGPGQQPGFVCPDLARKVVEIERGLRPPRLEIGNPDHSIDFCDVRDMICAYYKALVRGTAGEVYNLCSGRGVTVRAIAERFIELISTPVSFAPCSSANSQDSERGITGDNSRALDQLAWQASIPFQQTLDDVLEYWRGFTMADR